MSLNCNLKQSLFRPVVTMGLLLLGLPAVRAVNLVQEVHLPVPELQTCQANSAIVDGTSSAINSGFSSCLAKLFRQNNSNRWAEETPNNL